MIVPFAACILTAIILSIMGAIIKSGGDQTRTTR